MKDEWDATTVKLAMLEVEVARLRKNEALTKRKVIEEFKSSNDFQEAVETADSKYFGERFDFFKR